MRIVPFGLLSSCLAIVPLSPALAAEGRVPVYAAGTVLSEPGRYVLTRNLLSTGATPGVEIAAPRVELDLNGFTIDGNGNHGVLVTFGNDVAIRNGAITGADVGVELAGAGGGHAVIEDLRITAPASAGIRAVGLETIAIRRVVVHLSSGDGIVVDGNFGLTQGRIEACHLLRGNGAGIAVKGARGFSVVGNQVGTYGLEGIRLESILGGVVRENAVTSTGGSAGIYLWGARGVTLARNVVAESRLHGILVGNGSLDTHLVENLSTSNGTGPGFGDGIRVETLRAVLDGNVASDNDGIGVHLAAGSAYCTLGRNRARDNMNGGGQACGGAPALFPPNSCNDGGGDFTTFGDNLIPGPALF